MFVSESQLLLFAAVVLLAISKLLGRVFPNSAPVERVTESDLELDALTEQVKEGRVRSYSRLPLEQKQNLGQNRDSKTPLRLWQVEAGAEIRLLVAQNAKQEPIPVTESEGNPTAAFPDRVNRE